MRLLLLQTVSPTIVFTIFVLELWDSSTKQLTDCHRVLHGDDNTGN